MRPPAFYTSGRAQLLHFAGPRLLQIPAGSVDGRVAGRPRLLQIPTGCVDERVVGGGFAAANHISVYITRGLL